ncbi:MAG TPA: vitamin K epoxide reductase family protein [Vicinamibacterales bacterium]|nr:vitamin K epoxide reductase family protein [Vicinamibacterales bacterium]
MSKLVARLILALAGVGLVASVAAAYVHYQILYDPLYTSFCDISANVSCTDVYQSRFGTFAGIPVSIFGGIWFVAAGLLTLAGMFAGPQVRESIPGYLFAMSTLALAVVLYLLYASVAILGALCPMCLLTDAAIVGIFILSGTAASVPMTALPRRIGQDLRALVGSPKAVATAVLFVTAAASTLAFFPREAAPDAGGAPPVPTANQRSELEQFMATATRIPLVIPRDGAKVLIVKFNDFQCPACAGSWEAYKPILAKYEAQEPGAVRMVLRDYPLHSACNPRSSELHAAACEAAVAVRLAREHNRGEAMEEWLYTHQPGMTPAIVRQAAREIGQVTDFDARYAATLELVKADVALGNQLNVGSTPTFFINGVKVEGQWAPQYFDQAIAYELRSAPAQ